MLFQEDRAPRNPPRTCRTAGQQQHRPTRYCTVTLRPQKLRQNDAIPSRSAWGGPQRGSIVPTGCLPRWGVEKLAAPCFGLQPPDRRQINTNSADAPPAYPKNRRHNRQHPRTDREIFRDQGKARPTRPATPPKAPKKSGVKSRGAPAAHGTPGKFIS